MKVTIATGEFECLEWSKGSVVRTFPCSKKPEEKRYTNFDRYNGDLKNGRQRHGFGKLTKKISNKGWTYIGQWKDDLESGFGFLSQPHMPTLVGQFAEGKFQGAGVSFSYSKAYRTIQFGHWENGELNGPGLFIYPSGDKILGEYKNGKILEDITGYLYIFNNGTVINWPAVKDDF